MSTPQFVTSLLRQTAQNIWRHKLRSFLTMFGIAWGVCSLVLMSALCDGFRQGQRKNMAQLGDNLVFVYGGRTEMQAGGVRAGRRIHITRRAVEAIRDGCPTVATVAGELHHYETSASSAFNSGRFTVVGVDPEYLRLRNLPVETGRHISAVDVRDERRVCVLGSQVRKQLFEERPALGQRISLRGFPYEVVGLMGEKNQNSSYDGWDNEKILIPQSSLLHDIPASLESRYEGHLDAILYRPASLKGWRSAQDQVRHTLAALYGFDPRDKAAVDISDNVEEAELFDKTFDATEMFLAVVALVTLTLGGVSVMNTMMMGVAERTSEIGLRKALGATRRRILMDFFLEGVALAAASGAIGLGAVFTLAWAVSLLPMPALFSGLVIKLNTGLIAVSALGLVAIASALPPAWRAANLTPVEALREER